MIGQFPFNAYLRMKTLYIIGNGFDRYHGLPTSYADFNRYVTRNFIELEERLFRYFAFSLDSDSLWKNFEQELATFAYGEFMDSYNHIDVLDDSFKPSDFFSLEDEIEQETDYLIDDIRNAFSHWVESIELPENNYFQIAFSPDADFINFNYTETLEKYYAISEDRILYIHNKANDYKGELVFGHGEQELPGEKLDAFDEDGEPTRTMATDSENSAKYPFYALKKDTKAVMKENDTRLQIMTGITQITVLGHSLGEVDWPYFQGLYERFSSAKWSISFYLEEEREMLRQTARRMLPVSEDKISMVRIDDLEALVRA